MQRRTFIQSLALAAAGAALGAPLFAASNKKALGVQLWTIREYLKKDLVGSLSRLAKLGYNEIEVFDYNGTFWGKSPRECNKICNGLGLSIISSHYFTGRTNNAKGSLVNGWDKAVEDAAAINIVHDLRLAI